MSGRSRTNRKPQKRTPSRTRRPSGRPSRSRTPRESTTSLPPRQFGWSSVRDTVVRTAPFVRLAGMLLCIYIALSLVSFDRNDPSFVYSGAQPVSNFGGPLGAWIADVLFQIFGYGAWSVLGVGGFLAMKLAGRPTGDPRRLIGWAAVFWVGLCLLALIWPYAPEQVFAAGGLIGETSVGVMHSVVGPAGTWLMVLGCALAVSPVLLDVNLEALAHHGLRNIERAGPHLHDAGSVAYTGVLSVFSRATRRVVETIVSVPSNVKGLIPQRREEPDWQWAEEEDMDPPSEPDSIPPSSAGTGTRHPGSIYDEVAYDRSEPDFFQNATSSSMPGIAPGSNLSAPSAFFDEPDELFTPNPQDRTQIGQRELVEVEWETTHALAGRTSGVGMSSSRMQMPQSSMSGHGMQSAVAAVQPQPVPVAPMPSAPWPPSYQDRFDDLPPRRSQAFAEEAPRAEAPRVEVPVAEQVVEAQRPVHTPEPPAAPEPAPNVTAESVAAVHVPPPSTPVDLPEAASVSVQPRPEPAPPVVAPSVPQPPAVDEKKNARLEVDDEALAAGGDSDDGLAVVHVDRYADFELPHLGLLDTHERSVAQFDEQLLQSLANTLEQKLADFGVRGEVTAIRPGPVITTFEYLPAPGIKLSKISGLSDDIAMALKALRVRIVAPIPGKGVVGIEIPNADRQNIWIRDILANESFRRFKGALPMVLGKTVDGRPQVTDLAKMPHLLVGGTTGSGKSVGVNAMLMSMLFTRTPEELRLILIDPKTIEFELYRDIPHLLHPVVTDPRLASAALKWACAEMDERYRLLARWKTRNIESFNRKVEKEREDWTPAKARRYLGDDFSGDETPPPPRKMPYIVIVIDELADLMMVAAKDVEESIIRIAQKARAAGIHLIVATQRPSVNVITGLIKANMPSRIAFQIRTKVDSRTILDQNGAENLLGKGDMLFLPPGVAALERCHGAFVSDEEVREVNDFLRTQGEPEYEAELSSESESTGGISEEEYDELYDLAVAFVCREGKASTSMVQREFKIGYNRAARMIDLMEREGVVGPADGARPRKILVEAH